MEMTSGQKYAVCMGFMRKQLRFELLKTTIALATEEIQRRRHLLCGGEQ
jgi:hypothetical protein